MSAEFVVFNRFGNEVDSVDPYKAHTYSDLFDGYRVEQESGTIYFVRIPEGGRYEIREMENDND